MRENCQSGSMSGNRKQDQAKPDCGDEAKAQSTNHRETTVTAPVLDSTRDYSHHQTVLSVNDDCNSFREEATRGDILLRRGDAHGVGMFLAEGAYGRHPQLQRLSSAAQRYPGHASKSGVSGRPECD